ncbi:MAG: hypothetical protein ACRDQ0_10560, partial [Pseudonocardia sp.]
AKTNPAIVPLSDFVRTRYPGWEQSMVWKAHFGQGGLADRKTEGWTVWAYIDPTTTATQMDAVDAAVDVWGVPYGATDAKIAEVVARGKPVMVWEVHRYSEIARLQGLGVQGLMEAQWLYLNQPPDLAVDQFASQISVPGTLGLTNYSPATALKYDGAGGAYLDNGAFSSALMGAHRVPDPNTHTITYSLKWDTIPGSGQHSGVAFCKASDDRYQFSQPNPSGGYHTVVRANGDLELFRHDPAVTAGVRLSGPLPTVAPVAGQPMAFEVEVTSTQVFFRRTDVGPFEVSSTDTMYRGRYWHLSAGSATVRPTWSGISRA